MTMTPDTPQELLELNRKPGLSDERVDELRDLILDATPKQVAYHIRACVALMRGVHEDVLQETQQKVEDEELSDISSTDRLIIQTMDMKSWRVIQGELNALSYFC